MIHYIFWVKHLANKCLNKSANSYFNNQILNPLWQNRACNHCYVYVCNTKSQYTLKQNKMNFMRITFLIPCSELLSLFKLFVDDKPVRLATVLCFIALARFDEFENDDFSSFALFCFEFSSIAEILPRQLSYTSSLALTVIRFSRAPRASPLPCLGSMRINCNWVAVFVRSWVKENVNSLWKSFCLSTSLNMPVSSVDASISIANELLPFNKRELLNHKYLLYFLQLYLMRVFWRFREYLQFYIYQ